MKHKPTYKFAIHNTYKETRERKVNAALGIILFAIIMYFIWQPLFMWAASESL